MLYGEVLGKAISPSSRVAKPEFATHPCLATRATVGCLLATNPAVPLQFMVSILSFAFGGGQMYTTA